MRISEQVCNSQGKAKEAAKKELENYLSDFRGDISGEWGGSFPDGFMGSEKKGAIVWNKFADTIEEFAEKVINEELPNDDYAVSTTVIDMKNKKITSESEYILPGV